MISQRLWLPRLVAALFVSLILVFVFILIRGATFTTHKQVADLPALGTASLEQKKGVYYWLNNYSDTQRSMRAQIDKWVVVANAGCAGGAAESSICALSAETGKQGVRIIYRKERPPLMKRNIPWQGGYINPVNGAIYDLFGRAYKSSVNGAEPASLKVIQH